MDGPLVNTNVNLRQQKWADVGGGCLVTFTEKIFSLEIQLYLLQNSPFSLNMRHSTELFENVSNFLQYHLKFFGEYIQIPF